MRINGCSALVTGAASGLGLSTARALHAAGAHVVLFDLPNSPGAERAAELHGRAGTPTTRLVESVGCGAVARFPGIFLPGDVTVDADVQAAVEAAGALAPLRIVVNCAGIAPAARTVGRQGPMALADFERVLRVNLLGTFNVVRLAAAAMQATAPVGAGPDSDNAGSESSFSTPQGTAERGVIVNTASVAAFDGQIGQAAYAASKGGVAAMTLPLAREFARSLIRVMTIAPGLFDTPLLQDLPAEARASLGAQVPHPARLGDPAEYAALVRHIVENPMLNGETIRLDGGIRMAPQ
ncbi:SDR family NAD(P)-dependent oxidoreductase [Cryobacterium adonitolivorans]|uniref:SDR family NAD(P)-dependent oxidoreductase n=1 Tax=Cryobacterium adonitolivorans TaxID=1259189 RepID=A0A4V3ID95_9MICO|nr:SDR family NAD(P)-dependent oxidoreductase [Cryobacterium adonitolivorans]TFC05524.1 SDR family NAD(P)-dependent oxidoreductase [Cryobacterium adonitolivorans]